MVIIFRLVGWFGMAGTAFNTYFKLFADDQTALRYAGPGRDLDINISIFAFCVLPFVLGASLNFV